VGDALRGFEAEAEAGRGGVEPALELGGGGEGAEGVVDFDGGKARGVDGKEGAGGDVGGVEAGLPCGIGPAGCPGEEVARRGRERRWDDGGEFRGSRQTTILKAQVLLGRRFSGAVLGYIGGGNAQNFGVGSSFRIGLI